MVGLPFYCLIQAILFVGFSAIWLLYTTYLVSSAQITTYEDPVTGESYKEFKYSDRAKQSVKNIKILNTPTLISILFLVETI